MTVQGNYIHIDYAPSKDCMNLFSYSYIYVKCGCCSRNKNYRDRIRRRIKYYKEDLAEQYAFDNWCNNEKARKLQERNVQSNIRYLKRKIRRLKKIMRTMKGSGT